MRIGIVGNGVVGNATAKAWTEHCGEVRIYDARSELTSHSFDATIKCDLVFVCLPEGKIEDFCHAINGQNVPAVVKSTVPVGTTRYLRDKYDLSNLVHSPEFLTERCAMVDARNPAINIIGSPVAWADPKHRPEVLDDLVMAYVERFPATPIHVMSSDESETVKLMVNTALAVKVALFNEFREAAAQVDLSWSRILGAMLATGKIDSTHTRIPGPDGRKGFGGKCLPKDLEHFIHFAESSGVRPWIAGAAKCRNAEDRPDE